MPLSLTDLPYTIFTTIIAHLSPTQTILCRRLSRAFLSALTRADLCISLILSHFPRSLEGRRLRTYLKTGNLAALESGDWAAVFAKLARRYYHLGNALPWKVEKVQVLKDEEVLRGVAPWNRHLSLNGKTAAFHFWDPVWTVAPKEGLLVYPAAPPLLQGEDDDDDKGASAGGGGGGGGGGAAARYCYRARDLQTGREVDVPFDLRGRIVRRVRISHGVLVFEWCEQEPLSSSPPLVVGNETTTTERVHRHYATAYSVRRRGSWDGVIPRRHTDAGVAHDGSSEMPTCSWEFELRCEFEIHPVGLSLDHHDRFFSTHNATHYAVYTWQPPPRSPDAAWPDNEPLETLTIWEFNPANSHPERPETASSSPPPSRPDPTTSSPRIIRTLNNAQLRAFAILQHDAPALRAMALDDSTWDAARASACGHVFFTEEEHRWSAGPHSRPSRPRLHRVKTTGIPLVGAGPRWVDDCGGGGGVNLRFCWRGRWRRDMTEMDEDEDDGIMPHDDDGDGEGSVGGDDDKRGIWSPERAWSHSQTWPGRAPCWRHDDFPYVTLSEVFDAAAGVRVIARDCFMLETLSVHIRPKIRVQGVGPNGAKLVSRRASSGTDTKKTTTTMTTTTFTNTATPSPQTQTPIEKNSTTTTAAAAITEGGRKSTATTSNTAARTSTTTTTQGPDGHEVQFADAMWSEMMGKGFICGDERWLFY
ncbi:hypothetical protein A9Z42_0083250 [Trichoderma parareesei]|uniref:F-box domain-containing protein n=1 Tax=Trichoderma parareesei TaxID=858221 RepID=A0A2H3A669_TRIPA|nr:hypothetical protein A9Z42_0083250 [Trichoderma parareesei]